MGLMRRVESNMENAVERPRTSATSPRPAEQPNGKRGRKRDLRVEPKELAQKLIKEMEGHKISRSGGVTVSDLFTIYLCPADYDRYAPKMSDLVGKLERALAKHVRSKKYEVLDDVRISVVREPDLRPGYFGILAGRAGAAAASVPAPRERRESLPFVAGGASAAAPVHKMPVQRTIVLRVGNRVREFSQSRIIIGRAREADLQLDDPNVSRRHAALFWADGRVVVEDLDSTNGTMVNGYPVSTSVLRPNDVVVIGDSRITVEIRSD